tara:strand:- start:2 stop:259 length:258 start_codon:yes stop_codon:yes gene_type:complete
MKFNIDDIKTIIMALDELKGCHCYNHYENDYEWEQSFEKRWADEIDALLKRFKKSVKLKELYQQSLRNDRIYTRLKDSGLYEDML